MKRNLLKLVLLSVVLIIFVIAYYFYYVFFAIPKDIEREDIERASAYIGANIVEKDDPQEECGKQMIDKLKQLPVLATFEDYPVKEIYTGKFAPLDLSSSFIAGRFKTTISQDLAKNEVNFAGHYVITTLGFTGAGSILLFTDVMNGKSYPFPYASGNPYTGGFSYRKDSKLLIIDSVDDLDSSELCYHSDEDFRPYYFVWENNTTSLIGPKDGIFPAVSYRMLP